MEVVLIFLTCRQLAGCVQLRHCFTLHLPRQSATVTCVLKRLNSSVAGYGEPARKLRLREPSALPGKCKLQDSRLIEHIYNDWLVCNAAAQLRRVHTFKPLFNCYLQSLLALSGVTVTNPDLRLKLCHLVP